MKSGYYLDQCDDIAVVYPDGSIEVLTYFGEWAKCGKDGYYFVPVEFIGDL